MLKNISRSLTDLAGAEYIDAVCRASAALGLETGETLRPVPLRTRRGVTGSSPPRCNPPRRGASSHSEKKFHRPLTTGFWPDKLFHPIRNEITKESFSSCLNSR